MLNMHYAVIPRNLRTCGSRYSVLVRIEIRSRGIPADIVRHRCGNFAQAVNIVYVDVQRIRGRVFRGNRTVEQTFFVRCIRSELGSIIASRISTENQ